MVGVIDQSLLLNDFNGKCDDIRPNRKAADSNMYAAMKKLLIFIQP
jgi:hypothetical protein